MTETADHIHEGEDYWSKTPAEPYTGEDITGDDGELVISIPAAKYPAGKTATAQDSNLTAANIAEGITIFGVTGTHAGGYGLGIESIQHGTISLGTSDTTGTTTITEVDTSKSAVIFLGSSGPTDGDCPAGRAFCRVTLTNGTTVTGSREYSGAERTIAFIVVEFSGDGIAAQAGTITIDDTTGTTTITEVDTSKTILLPGGWTYNSNVALRSYMIPRIALTNSTTVTGIRERSTGEVVAGFTAVEFTA
jgi:hypothetical protein